MHIGLFFIVIVIVSFEGFLDTLNIHARPKKAKETRKFMRVNTLRLLALCVVFVMVFYPAVFQETQMILQFGFLCFLTAVVIEMMYASPKISNGRRLKMALQSVLMRRVFYYGSIAIVFLGLFEQPVFDSYLKTYIFIIVLSAGAGTLFFRVFLHRLFTLVPYRLIRQNEQVKTQYPELDTMVYMVKSKKFRLPINAMYLGMFGRKRILVSDALLHRLSGEQIKAILIHELGHGKYRHLWIRTALILFILMVYLFLGYAVFDIGIFPTADTVILRILFALTGYFILEKLTLFCFNQLAHQQEHQADYHTYTLGYHQALAQALFMINQHQPEPSMHPLSHRLMLSHPPLRRRLARLAALGDIQPDLGIVFDIRPLPKRKPSE